MKTLRLNNTKIANSIRRYRDLPGYRLTVTVSRRNSREIIRSQFVITNDLLPWDLAVADAIYSLHADGCRKITPRSVLVVLSGDDRISVPAQRRLQLEQCIDRLIATQIHIDCAAECALSPSLLPRYGGGFLCAEKIPGGYRLPDEAPMPLYAYAEAKRQIITVPTALLACISSESQHMVNSRENLLLRHHLIHELELIRNPNNSVSEKTFFFRGKQSEPLWEMLELDAGAMPPEFRAAKARELYRKTRLLMESWQTLGYLTDFTADPQDDSIRIRQGMMCADPFDLPFPSWSSPSN